MRYIADRAKMTLKQSEADFFLSVHLKKGNNAPNTQALLRSKDYKKSIVKE